MSEEKHQLKGNSLGLWESIVMGIAGTAPAYSIAATTGVLIATVGPLSALCLFYSGLIMFGVALAFMHLNRIHTHAGASYSWVGQVFHPILGFFSGWSLLVASTVFMVSGTVPASIATLALIRPEYVNNPVIVSLVAACWLLLVSAVVIKGIKLSSYFQVTTTLVEITILAIIMGGALYTFSPNIMQSFSLEKLSMGKFTLHSFSEGALVALFFFWGWDVTVNLSEETKNGADNSGRGAVVSMVIVLLLFVSFIIVVQAGLTDLEIEAAGTNILLVLSQKIFSGPYNQIALIAVLAVILSTIGTLETTILQFSRTMFAKGRDGILNPRYATLHSEWKTPWLATLTIMSIGLILLLVAAFSSTVNDILLVSVKAIGFQVAFYYGLTSFACAWRFRHLARQDMKNFFLLICWPILSGTVMSFVFLYSMFTFNLKTTVIGIGGIALGVIPLVINRRLRK
ncbi:MAG: APC family permease [Chlamydiales bacterium]|nr:APC family permease [Chlamydiia bacterium]MCP5506791.1 APC family permease [Chlamydiales bacterium]